MNRLLSYLLFTAFGVALGAGFTRMFTTPPDDVNNTAQASKKPLYWVAPMDPDYRRDAPGKSPMGMDLVPVFSSEQMPGVVEISPQIVNSLGVRTTTVKRSPLNNTIKTVGYVAYNQDRLIHVHPRVAGWIEKLYVTAQGNPVDQGAPLYDLYSPQLVNAQEELISALERNDSLLITAAADRLRALQITDSFITQLMKDRKVRQTVTFTSPQQGVLETLNVRDGVYVSPETALMTIGALDEVWVEAQIFESQASTLAVGQRATMQVDYLPGREWVGVVEYLYPSLEAKTRSLRARLRFDNDDRALRPNMFTRVRLHSDGGSPTLHVPVEAVIRTGSQDRVVRALGDGRFQSVAVGIGRVSDRRIEILKGLAAGDRVVSSAQFLLDSESGKTAEFSRIDQEKPEDKPMHADHQMPVNHDQHQDHSMPVDHENHRDHVAPESEPHHD